MVTRWLKKIGLKQVLTVFLAGVLLLVSTACSGGALARTADQVEEEVPSSALTNKFEGGMNNYRDTDPRRDVKGAEAKGQALVRDAQQHLEKSIDSKEDYARNYKQGTPLDERVKNLGEDIGESVSKSAEEFAEGTERGVKNLKKNASTGVDAVGDTVEDGTGNLKDSVKRTADNASKAANKANKGTGVQTND